MTHELFQKYLDRQCTAEEKVQVQEWLNGPEAALDAIYQNIWLQSNGTMPEAETKLLWRKLEGTLVNSQSAIASGIDKPGASIVKLLFVRMRAVVAAAMLLLVGGGCWYFMAHRWTKIDNASSVAKRIVLPDSSVVWLHGHAALWYSPVFNRQERAVRIKGEAYFIVKEDPTRPFLVYTPAIVAKVLGTEFNVEAYEEERVVKVSLNKGKVAISPAGPATAGTSPDKRVSEKILLPGQMLRADKKSNTMLVQPIPVQKVQAWTTGGFVVNDLTLEQVIVRMEQQYNIRIHYNDQTMLQSCENIASTFRQESWQQIIRQVCFTCHIRCEIKGRDVHLFTSP